VVLREAGRNVPPSEPKQYDSDMPDERDDSLWGTGLLDAASVDLDFDLDSSWKKVEKWEEGYSLKSAIDREMQEK